MAPCKMTPTSNRSVPAPKLYNYNPQQITLIRDDNYWGIPYFGTPAPKYVAHPIFKSDAGNLAFERGQIDMSAVCPRSVENVGG